MLFLYGNNCITASQF